MILLNAFEHCKTVSKWGYLGVNSARRREWNSSAWGFTAGLCPRAACTLGEVLVQCGPSGEGSLQTKGSLKLKGKDLHLSFLFCLLLPCNHANLCKYIPPILAFATFPIFSPSVLCCPSLLHVLLWAIFWLTCMTSSNIVCFCFPLGVVLAVNSPFLQVRKNQITWSPTNEVRFHLFFFPLGLPRLILFLVRKFYLALTLNVSFLSCMLWFLVSLQENSSPESYIYKVLQGSPLSLLLASYIFNSSGISLWVSAFDCFSSSIPPLHWVFLTVSKAQGHLAGTAMLGVAKRNTTGSTRLPPFLLLNSSAPPNTILLQFCIAKSCLSYCLWCLQAP